jgi:hypothetical protein
MLVRKIEQERNVFRKFSFGNRFSAGLEVFKRPLHIIPGDRFSNFYFLSSKKELSPSDVTWGFYGT